MIKRGPAVIALIVLGLLAGCAEEQAEVTTCPVETQIAVETTEATTQTPLILELSMNELSMTEIGEKVTIYSGDIPAEMICWSSDNSAVAVVDRGVVTAMGSGIANIYGTYEDQSVACTVNSSAMYTHDRNPVRMVPEYESVDAAFFDDAVIVGDSISMTLFRCHNGMLGNAQFLVQGSYSLHNAVYDSAAMNYRGHLYKNLEDAIAATGARKVFIMLGVNDLGLFGVDKTMDFYRMMIESIQSTCPNTQIYIQSMTPVWTGAEGRLLTNYNIHLVNYRLRLLTQEYGCGFIDIASYMQDFTGGLATAYTSDRYVHLSEAGVKVWASVLRAYPNYMAIPE